MNFIQACCRGKEAINKIDDYVDQWHENHTHEPLHIFLGMTYFEYKVWLESKDPENVLLEVIKSHKSTVIVNVKNFEQEIEMFQSTSIYQNKSTGYKNGFIDCVSLSKQIIEERY